jgi:hypothetical protein
MNDIKRKWTKVGTAMPFVKSLMKMQLVTATRLMKIAAKIPWFCGPPPSPKGAIGGFVGVALITAAHFHAPCCIDWYMNYFPGKIPTLLLYFSFCWP